MTRYAPGAAAAAVTLLGSLMASEPAARRPAAQPVPARATKLTLPVSAVTRAPARRPPASPRLSAALTKRLAIDAGMPRTHVLNGTPVSLSARRMYVDGVAHLASQSLSFTTAPDNDHFRLGDDRSLVIHFNAPRAGTFVLIAIHGTKTFGGTAEARLIVQPGVYETMAVATVGPIIPFAVECKTAGWQQVVFLVDGAQVGYDLERIDLSVFK